jgi:hypothetical protein
MNRAVKAGRKAGRTMRLMDTGRTRTHRATPPATMRLVPGMPLLLKDCRRCGGDLVWRHEDTEYRCAQCARVARR